MTSISVSTMFIPVYDPDESLAFYRDALGLEVRGDVSADGYRWVTVGAPGQDVDVVLFQPHGGRSKTEDLDETFEKARASGAEEMQEPVSQPWGARDCAFRDPAGNMVRIAQA